MIKNKYDVVKLLRDAGLTFKINTDDISENTRITLNYLDVQYGRDNLAKAIDIFCNGADKAAYIFRQHLFHEDDDLFILNRLLNILRNLEAELVTTQNAAIPFPKSESKRAHDIHRVNNIFQSNNDYSDHRIVILNDGVRNLVSLFALNQLIFGEVYPLNDKLIKSASKIDIFYAAESEDYLVPLNDVDSILRKLKAQDLRNRFDREIFMNLPLGGGDWDIHVTFFESVDSPCGSLNIFSGDGFAENRFFVDVQTIADLLGPNTNTIAFEEVINRFGLAIVDKVAFVRLDDTPKIIRFYISLLSNGSNQHNKNIQRKWQFIHWFDKEFYPNFLKDNVQYKSRVYIQPSALEEPTEQSDDLTVRQCFDFLNRIFENYAKNLGAALKNNF